MKYIRFQRDVFILFSSSLIHEEVARAVRFSSGGAPTSARIVVRNSEGELVCTGKSDSIGIKADSDDTGRLKAFLNSA